MSGGGKTFSETSGENWSEERERLLQRKISELGLKLEGTRLEKIVERFYEELGAAGIRFKPKVYLSEKWGCPEGVPIIGIPFYLADEKLSRIADEILEGIEGETEGPRQKLLEFTRFVIQLSQQQPVLQRQKFFQGREIRGSEIKDLTWFRPDGKEMSQEDWDNPETRCFGLRLAGDAIDEVDSRGNPIVGDTLLILLNSYHEPISFVLPDPEKALWQLLLDTREETGKPEYLEIRGGEPYRLEARSLALFRFRAG